MKPPLSEKRKKEITEKIAEFVALDMRPVCIVEVEGFKEILSTLEPDNTVPTRATVMDVVHTKYLSTGSETYKAIQDCEAVSFTTDIWTSHQMEAYLTVTSHFITRDWRLKSFVLETKKMEDSHTADHIARELTEIICEWDIPRTKIISVVHDNAANTVACTNQLVQQPSWGNIVAMVEVQTELVSDRTCLCSKLLYFGKQFTETSVNSNNNFTCLCLCI